MMYVQFLLLAVSSPVVEWRCSTEGKTWQAYPLQEPAPEPEPASICTLIPNLDCWGNDIKRELGIKSAGDCCGVCTSTAGCAAWTYDTTSSHRP